MLDGEFVVPTPYTRGPWDPDQQHGGPVGGLAAWAMVGLVDEHMVLTRLTVELHHPVPVAPLEVSAEIVRPGYRVSVTGVEISAHGKRRALASAQWCRRTSAMPILDRTAPPTRPVNAIDPGASHVEYPRTGFNCDVAEIRSVFGTTEDPGPSTIWLRQRVPLFEGDEFDPLTFVATMADLGIAAGWEESPSGAPYINPDLTLQLARYPRGEWLCFESRTHPAGHGIAYCETRLWDDHGPIGRVLQTMIEANRDHPF